MKRALGGLAGPTIAAVAMVGCSGETTEPPSTTAYLERLGTDTLAVEIVRRSPGLIEGEVLARTPVTRYTTYALHLDDQGRLTRFETEHVTPAQNPAGPGRWVATVDFADGRATVAREVQTGVDSVSLDASDLMVVTPGRVPTPIGILEHAISRAELDTPGSSAIVEILTPWGTNPRTTPTTFTARGGSEYELDFFGNPMVVSTDGEGRVVGLSGAQTTMKVEIEPIPEPDMGALAADYATRDFEGTGIGSPSPPATAEATIGGANLTIEYSQPAKRGREIWGGLVSYGSVWRTGANGATHLRTDRPILLGDLELPAGDYTLWTTFTPEEAILIVNSQTRIWGTAYDAEQDFGRTALQRADLDEAVERFTISIEPVGDAATLNLEWDRTRFSAPVRVR
ncbi:MAG: DUF2911 domain-containing protein [Gemmatimonadota bacterium]|nr:DUF2911 domain-containing protein [Gemmatimonadota bacterium]